MEIVRRTHDLPHPRMPVGRDVCPTILENCPPTQDETLRRKPGQSLKKAVLGAPFGWTAEGTPYIGTQYCVKGGPRDLKFASLSTRNGGEQYFWKSMTTLTSKVALSALETHGTVGNLRGGESSAPCSEILPPESLDAARAVFVRLLGEETVRKFEDTEAVASKSQEAVVATDAPGSSSGGTSKTDMEHESAVGQKRKARMAMADEVKAKRGNNARPELDVD
jgi:hypothetical protein